MQGKRERPDGDKDPGGNQRRRKAEGQDADADPDTDDGAESAESAEDDDSEEEEFTLDEFGRVPGGILPDNACYPDLNYGYRCFPSFLDPAAADLAKLVADCRTTFTARTTRKGQKYSAGETYWLAKSAEPRCALEKLARDVFDLHTKGKEAGVDYDPGVSGAEWWTLVLDSEDDVGLHWDRDYEMEASADILVHPHLSTVTYLTNVGGMCLRILKCLVWQNARACFCQRAHTVTSPRVFLFWRVPRAIYPSHRPRTCTRRTNCGAGAHLSHAVQRPW